MISEQLLALKEATYPHLNPALAEQARFVQEDVVGCCQRSRHRRADFVRCCVPAELCAVDANGHRAFAVLRGGFDQAESTRRNRGREVMLTAGLLVQT